MFLPTNTPDTSDEQIIQMNNAWVSLIKYGYTAKQAAALIKSIRTVFYQNEYELLDLSIRISDYPHENYGIDFKKAFKTGKGPIDKRLTRKWADGWKYMDEHETIGKYECLGRVHTSGHDDDMTERSKTITVFMVGASVNQDEAISSLEEQESGTSCQHEYDCCGCWHYRAECTDVATIGASKIYTIVTGGYRNY